ncbi:MAG: sodium:proton antiporter [Planctomycetaceae bacterium]|nr:sodium:proton antiporter [Planctomycetaceae bacterium]
MNSSFLASIASGGPPVWTVLPFAVYLLAIALLPLLARHFWEKHRNKLIVALLASAPVVAFLLGTQRGPLLLHGAKEYAAFIALLASLFVISGSIFLKGSPPGTPAVNTGFLALGAVLASVIGTTGASMLLIRPLLRANEKRRRKTPLVVFFIFIVSNGGGLLTPLGDPPLFLGFLRGVPFLWTLELLGPWALVNGALLAIFHLLDRAMFRKEDPGPAGPQPGEPLRILGSLNFLWLLGVLAINVGVGHFGKTLRWNDDSQKSVLVAGMAAMAALSRITTPKDLRRLNKFSWGPILEVAVIFSGIFVTMVPATLLLEHLGQSGAVRMDRAWQFFWGSGVLSSFLDNAPAYVTFASLACGVVGAQVGQTVDPADLATLLAHPQGAWFLKAVSCGCVFMGANTYIGNGPNFMVKAIAEESGVRMPGFFGYLGWSAAILIPLFLVVTLVFFR